MDLELSVLSLCSLNCGVFACMPVVVLGLDFLFKNGGDEPRKDLTAAVNNLKLFLKVQFSRIPTSKRLYLWIFLFFIFSLVLLD